MEIQKNKGYEQPVEVTSGLKQRVDQTDIALWRGKPLEECEKSELLEVIEHLTKTNAAFNSFEICQLKREKAELKEENTKLWKCLGARA